jgi:NADPH-dependent curcumin reductase CurA
MTMTEAVPAIFRQWVHARPMDGGKLGLEQFALREAAMPKPAPGQALVRVLLVNIHAATRLRLAIGAAPIGETDRHNYACAQVVRSRDPAFREGDLIACQAGWQDYQIVSSADASVGYGPASPLVRALNGTNSQWTYVFRPVMREMWPPPVLMDVFGTSGMTAYFGLRECGPLMPRDRVLVAGASGSVGSIAAQLARKAGCHVVALAGGEDRRRWVIETLGVGACLDYRAADFDDQLRAAFPSGIDVFCDGVGGELTVKAVQLMNADSRLFAYGAAASHYGEAPAPAGPRPRGQRAAFVPAEAEPIIAAKSIKVEAWIVHDFYHERLAAEDDLSRLLLSGALKPTTHTVEGFENLPQAVVGLYRDRGPGKLQVRFG